MKKIILASNNGGKIAEIQMMLSQHNTIEIIPQSALDIPEIEETAFTFVENALIKARHAAKLSGLPALADDSGLAIDALHGEPGVFSARYAGPNARNEERIAKVLTAMKNIPDEQRSAHFYSVIVFLREEKDPAPIICQGQWDGYVLHEPQGDRGFGYDPIFYDPQFKKSAAELSENEKNRISHRGQALKKLIQASNFLKVRNFTPAGKF